MLPGLPLQSATGKSSPSRVVLVAMKKSSAVILVVLCWPVLSSAVAVVEEFIEKPFFQGYQSETLFASFFYPLMSKFKVIKYLYSLSNSPQ